jgi:hypothetical protein
MVKMVVETNTVPSVRTVIVLYGITVLRVKNVEGDTVALKKKVPDGRVTDAVEE